MTEEIKEETKETTGGMADFFSPAAVMLFATAILIDGAGLIVLFTGLDDLGILDIIGFVLVGGMMYVHSGTVVGTKGAQKMVKKAGTKILKKLGLSFLGEIIPYFGSIAPCWTLAVYFHLKGK